jgi:hypothetical protein
VRQAFSTGYPPEVDVLTMFAKTGVAASRMKGLANQPDGFFGFLAGQRFL